MTRLSMGLPDWTLGQWLVAFLVLVLALFAMVMILMGIGYLTARRAVLRDQRRNVPMSKGGLSVGDRVVAIGKVDYMDLTEKSGVVVYINPASTYPIGVEFDEPIPEGHSCWGRGRDGRCRFGKVQEFRKI